MDLVPEPYLHLEKRRIYNPIRHRWLQETETDFTLVKALIETRTRLDALSESTRRRLHEEGWLYRTGPDRDTRYYLRYVSLEANSDCNQACYFCPVSVAPRKKSHLSLDLYRSIARQLSEFSTLEAVFMNQYNEPTASKDFLEHVKILTEYKLPTALLTNASGLTPKRSDQLRELGGIEYLCVNISTLDAKRYAKDRGQAHLPLVVKNLHAIMDRPVARINEIVVLGTESFRHKRDFAALRKRFEPAFRVRFEPANDRSGYLAVGRSREPLKSNLRGCEQTGSRPLQHLHITADAQAVLCCQDYEGTYPVGDLSRQTVKEVLSGPDLARMRRKAYGLEASSPDFICRRCQFAL